MTNELFERELQNTSINDVSLADYIRENYVPVSVLEQIRAEILHLDYLNIEDGSDGYDKYIEQYEVLKIIDKYR